MLWFTKQHRISRYHESTEKPWSSTLHTIPSGSPWPIFATTNAETKSGQPIARALPEWKGRVGRVYPDASGATFAGGACGMCEWEEGQTEWRLVPIILRTRLVRWVSLRPCTTYSAGLILLPQRWLSLEVRAPLNPVVVSCRRFKRTPACPRY